MSEIKEQVISTKLFSLNNFLSLTKLNECRINECRTKEYGINL